MTNTATPCPSSTPSWFTGHWKDWHRGHGCGQDDGKPRSDTAITAIAQHEANKDSAGIRIRLDDRIYLRFTCRRGDLSRPREELS